MTNLKEPIFVSGHTGMVGSAIVRVLKKKGFDQILTVGRGELDLTNQSNVYEFFKRNKVETVFNAAAKVGGIVGNASFPADYILDNLTIQTNLINASLKNSIDRFVFLGSCCIYPKNCPQPMREDHLLTDVLEPTNTPYAVSKIAGIVSCGAAFEQYGMKSVCPMPINLFGPGDNLDPESSHVVPGLMRRLHFAKVNGEKRTTVWGSGLAKREYMHVDDCAEGVVFVSDKIDDGSLVNIAPGTELTTRQTAEAIAEIVGYEGELEQDTTKPDGTMRKLASSERIEELGWKPRIDFFEGLRETYDAFKEELERFSLRSSRV